MNYWAELRERERAAGLREKEHSLEQLDLVEAVSLEKRKSESVGRERRGFFEGSDGVSHQAAVFLRNP